MLKCFEQYGCASSLLSCYLLSRSTASPPSSRIDISFYPFLPFSSFASQTLARRTSRPLKGISLRPFTPGVITSATRSGRFSFKSSSTRRKCGAKGRGKGVLAGSGGLRKSSSVLACR